ncbi:MAG: hypothetical protein K2P58_04825 [Hyphomonadaceae bacterium]|nr:hypothetical protein [Hyphomonadaceae bacterium]
MRLSLATLLCALLLGCTGGNDPAVGDCRGTFDLYIRDQPNLSLVPSFSDYAPEVQYKIFICAHQYVHPGRNGYAVTSLALQGEPMALLLASKLRESRHSMTTFDTLVVFREMVQTGAYDVSGNSELMSLLANKVADVGDSSTRASAQSILDQIGLGPPRCFLIGRYSPGFPERRFDGVRDISRETWNALHDWTPSLRQHPNVASLVEFRFGEGRIAFALRTSCPEAREQVAEFFRSVAVASNDQAIEAELEVLNASLREMTQAEYAEAWIAAR